MNYHDKSKEELITEVMELQQELCRIKEVALGNEIGNVQPLPKVMVEDNDYKTLTESTEYLYELNYKDLFDKSPIGVAYHKLVYNAAGKPVDYFFIDANQTFQQLTGVDPRGKTVTHAFPGIENDPFDWIGKYAHVAQTGEEIHFEQFFALVGRWYSCVAFRTIPDHFVVTFLDITDRKLAEIELKEKNEEIEAQNEEYLQINEELHQTSAELIKAKEKAEESDRLKTAFLQNLSHEIRTPMNAIMGFSGLLVQNYNNKPKLERFSEIINQRCNDLLDIINDILDIAKIEAGQLPVNIEECSINSLFTELTTFFTEYQAKMGKQHISFYLQAICDPNQNLIVTDKVKLKQIFINLISNAFKFTDKGKIEGGCKMGDSGKLIFYVSDTGIGIPADKKQMVFERFAQINQKFNLAVGGTGLGLSIVKGLVELLGGQIWVDSEPGKGSTFYFSIPYKQVQSKVSETNTDDEKETYMFPSKTVLIVEDDVYNAEYLKEILSDLGLNILHTEFGDQAVQISLNQPVDLVLMDIRLPDIDGYEATRQIKQHKPNIKIIAQTAYASNQEKQKALKEGCIDYISKPTNPDLLLAMVNKHLKKKR